MLCASNVMRHKAVVHQSHPTAPKSGEEAVAISIRWQGMPLAPSCDDRRVHNSTTAECVLFLSCARAPPWPIAEHPACSADMMHGVCGTAAIRRRTQTLDMMRSALHHARFQRGQPTLRCPLHHQLPLPAMPPLLTLLLQLPHVAESPHHPCQLFCPLQALQAPAAAAYT